MNFSLSSGDIPSAEQSPTPHSAPLMQYLFSISLRFLNRIHDNYVILAFFINADALRKKRKEKPFVLLAIKNVANTFCMCDCDPLNKGGHYWRHTDF